MLQNFWEYLLWAIGGGEIETGISAWQLVLRTIIIYIVALLIIRVAKRRFMGKYSSFDILLGFVIGSVLSRAITGAVRFLDMIIIVSMLVLLHWLIAYFSYYSERLGKFFKNSARELVIDGELQEEALRKSKIGHNDLMQALREEANVDSLDNVKTAYLERDGNITVIPRSCRAHTIDVKVEEGVQTIKIEITH